MLLGGLVGLVTKCHSSYIYPIGGWFNKRRRESVGIEEVMAIGRAKGPRVIAVGELEQVKELPPIKETGVIWGAEATLRTDDGASVFVKFRLPRQGDDADALSKRVGHLVAIWATASAGQRGEELWFDGEVTPDDLDLIHSAQAVKA